MGEPARKLAFQKSTGSWVIVAPAGDGYEVAETLDPEDASNWTGEAYDLARAHPKASAELKPKLDWYRDNMIEEPSGPLDENGKTTATPQPANDNATAAPANDNAAPVRPSPVAEDDKPSSVWGALAKSGKSFLNDLGNAGAATFGDGPLIQEPPAWLRSDDTEDVARGVGQGASFRFGDELSAGLEAADATLTAGAEDLPSAQRRSGRAFDAPLMTDDEREDAYYDEALERNRTGNATSQERSPWLYGAGEAVGMTPATIASAPLFGTAGAAKGAAAVPWKTLAMRSAGQGAVTGAITGAGGGTEGNRLSSSAIGAGTGAVGGAAGSAIGSGLGYGARAVVGKVDDAVQAAKNAAPVRAIRDFAAEQAPRFRLASVGPYGSQVKKIMQREGFDYTERELGDSIEAAYPADKGALGFPKLRSPRDFAKQARPRMEQSGREIGEALEAMDEQGVSAPLFRDPVNPGDERAVLDVLDEEVAKYGNPLKIGKKDKALKGALDEVRANTLGLSDFAAERSLGQGVPRLSATELATVKRSLEESFPDSVAKSVSDAAAEQAEMIGSAGPREALREAAERGADPATFQRWQSANKEYPLHATVAELAEGRTAQEQGNQIASLPAAVGTVASGGVGLPIAAMWEGAKRYGADAVAHGMYGTAKGLTPAAARQGLPLPALQQATQTAGARAGVPWGSLVRQGQPAMAQGAPRVEIGEAQITSRPQQRAETSNGHNLQRAVQNSLRIGGKALGPFKEQLRAVEQDPVALSAAINDLMADPKFRDVVVPELQATPNGDRRMPGDP